MERLLAERGAPGRLLRNEVVILALILALALGLRILWITLSEARPVGADSYWYDTVARNMAAGKGFANPGDPSVPTALFPPGYPTVLGVAYKLVSADLWVAQTINVVAALATIVILYLIARMTFGRPAAAWSAFVFAVLPSQVMFPQLLVSEPLFILLLTSVVGLLLLERRLPLSRAPLLMVGAGVLAGAAALVRGQALALIPFVLVWWLVSHRGRVSTLLPALLFVASMALVILPWTVRNWAQLGSPILISSNLGWDAAIGHNENADGSWMFPGDFFVDTLDLPLPDREAEINRKGIHLAWDYAKAHPIRELELSFKKAVRLWKEDDDAVWWQEIGMKPYLSATERANLDKLCNASYYAALALCAVGLATSWRRARPFWLLGLLLAAAWTASHFVIFTENRFHYPLLPLIAVGGGAGLASIIDRWRPSSRTR